MHIAVSGNIGSGKTTLTKMLAHHYGWTPKFETVLKNPYLEDYYGDIGRWSFAMEVFFLKERFRDILDIAHHSDVVIQDRTIYEGVHVFVANNYRMGNLSDRDYDTYMELYRQMTEMVKFPQLMIYLRAQVPHLVKNIQKRGRDYEQTIQLDYLKGLNNLYEDFITRQYTGRVLTIDVDNLDFEHEKKDFLYITQKLDALVYGLFPITE